jgi:hypothetical protein
VEGYTEKYGMEYRRAYWDEKPDDYLVERHRRQIFPLLKKRYLFSQVQDFLLYDFYSPEGYVNEDVFAYSNRAGEEKGLVVYHNKFANARGWIRISAAYSIKTNGTEHMLIQKRLGEGLGLTNDGDTYCIFRDSVNGLEYIRNSKEMHEKGLYVELEAYKCQVFTSFHEVQDNEFHQYANLSAYLNGRGVPSIDETLKEIFLQPIHQTYRELVNPGYFRWVITNRMLALETSGRDEGTQENLEKILRETEGKAVNLLEEVKSSTHSSADSQPVIETIKRNLLASLYLPVFKDKFYLSHSRIFQQLVKYLHAGDQKTSPWNNGDTYAWSVILGWIFTGELGRMITQAEYEEISRSWIDEWMLNKIIISTMSELLTTHHKWWDLLEDKQDKLRKNPNYAILISILSDSDSLAFLGVNRYQDILWFNKEAFEDLMWWLMIVAVVEITGPQINSNQAEAAQKLILSGYKAITTLLRNARASGYQLERLLDLTK